MRMERKQVTKEDGRYLVYYHFPNSANSEETHVFEALETAQAHETGIGDVAVTPGESVEAAQGNGVAEGQKRV